MIAFRARYVRFMIGYLIAVSIVFATAASAREVVIPVITGAIGDRTYRTTVDLRSASAADCRFELRRSDGPTLRSTEHLDAGKTTLLDEFGSEVQPLATTVRVSCTGAVEVHSRIHESADGGATFDEGPLYRASSGDALVAGQTFTTPITGDSILAEVRGAPARIVATLTATSSGRVADRVYDLAGIFARCSRRLEAYYLMICRNLLTFHGSSSRRERWTQQRALADVSDSTSRTWKTCKMS